MEQTVYIYNTSTFCFLGSNQLTNRRYLEQPRHAHQIRRPLRPLERKLGKMPLQKILIRRGPQKPQNWHIRSRIGTQDVQEPVAKLRYLVPPSLQRSLQNLQNRMQASPRESTNARLLDHRLLHVVAGVKAQKIMRQIGHGPSDALHHEQQYALLALRYRHSILHPVFFVLLLLDRAFAVRVQALHEPMSNRYRKCWRCHERRQQLGIRRRLTRDILDDAHGQISVLLQPTVVRNVLGHVDHVIGFPGARIHSQEEPGQSCLNFVDSGVVGQLRHELVLLREALLENPQTVQGGLLEALLAGEVFVSVQEATTLVQDVQDDVQELRVGVEHTHEVVARKRRRVGTLPVSQVDLAACKVLHRGRVLFDELVQDFQAQFGHVPLFSWVLVRASVEPQEDCVDDEAEVGIEARGALTDAEKPRNGEVGENVEQLQHRSRQWVFLVAGFYFVQFRLYSPWLVTARRWDGRDDLLLLEQVPHGGRTFWRLRQGGQSLHQSAFQGYWEGASYEAQKYGKSVPIFVVA